MASLLGTRNFIKIQDNGLARAIKLADIYIASNSDAGGDVIDPNVYQYAISNYLSPYSDNLDVQKKILGYQNKVKDLNQKGADQDITLSSFKRNLIDAVYVRGESLRDPATMAYSTAEALDNIVIGLDSAVDYLDKKNKSADRLIDFRKQVSSMADAQRVLVNRMGDGTLPPNLDGYGYYIKTNPIDGAITGAALLPINSAPSELKDNTKRIEQSVMIGNSSLPVYLPVVQNAEGEYEARIYDNAWSGTNQDPVLTSKAGNYFKDNPFSLEDSSKFPVYKTNLQAGTFGKVLAGVSDGQSKYNYYYRGFDDKLRILDEESINSFKQDPIFNRQLSGYIPLLSSDDVSVLGKAERTNPREIKTFGLKAALTQAQFESEQATQQMQKADTSYLGRIQRAGEAVGGFFSKRFSGRKNEPNQPETTPVTSEETTSTPDLIEQGKSFFRDKNSQ